MLYKVFASDDDAKEYFWRFWGLHTSAVLPSKYFLDVRDRVTQVRSKRQRLLSLHFPACCKLVVTSSLSPSPPAAHPPPDTPPPPWSSTTTCRVTLSLRLGFAGSHSIRFFAHEDRVVPPSPHTHTHAAQVGDEYRALYFHPDLVPPLSEVGVHKAAHLQYLYRVGRAFIAITLSGFPNEASTVINPQLMRSVAESVAERIRFPSSASTAVRDVALRALRLGNELDRGIDAMWNVDLTAPFSDLVVRVRSYGARSAKGNSNEPTSLAASLDNTDGSVGSESQDESGNSESDSSVESGWFELGEGADDTLDDDGVWGHLDSEPSLPSSLPSLSCADARHNGSVVNSNSPCARQQWHSAADSDAPLVHVSWSEPCADGRAGHPIDRPASVARAEALDAEEEEVVVAHASHTRKRSTVYFGADGKCCYLPHVLCCASLQGCSGRKCVCRCALTV
jgi:hypothetical protein